MSINNKEYIVLIVGGFISLIFCLGLSSVTIVYAIEYLERNEESAHYPFIGLGITWIVILLILSIYGVKSYIDKYFFKKKSYYSVLPPDY